MIIHVIGQTMYTTDLYNLINDYFVPEEHVFLTGKAKDPSAISPIGIESKLGDALIVPPKNILKYIRLLDKADAIIIHGLFSYKHLALISRKREWLKKTCWIVWGGDIYRHNDKKRSISDKLTEFFKIKYAPEIGYLATLVDQDLPKVREWYGVKGDCCPVSYPLPVQRKGVFSSVFMTGRKKNNSNLPVKIVLGNSATITNCHREAIDLLEKYKKEDFILYLPLSYGFHGYEEYAQIIVDYANKKLGSDKVKPILEKMDGNSYVNFLKEMNIGLFYNDRQQAMGNIAILLAAGAKIFIRSDTTMWNHYINRGYRLEDAFEITKLSFSDFISYDPEKKKNNMEWIEKYLDPNVVVNKWEKLFSVMKEHRIEE